LQRQLALRSGRHRRPGRRLLDQRLRFFERTLRRRKLRRRLPPRSDVQRDVRRFVLGDVPSPEPLHPHHGRKWQRRVRAERRLHLNARYQRQRQVRGGIGVSCPLFGHLLADVRSRSDLHDRLRRRGRPFGDRLGAVPLAPA
jgi:Txe/YoeB family toxin of Txe-Axe toxin-antitoxin module